MASASNTAKRSPKSDPPDSDATENGDGNFSGGDVVNGKRMKKDNSNVDGVPDSNIPESIDGPNSSSGPEQSDDLTKDKSSKDFCDSTKDKSSKDFCDSNEEPSASAMNVEAGESSTTNTPQENPKPPNSRVPVVTDSSDDDIDIEVNRNVERALNSKKKEKEPAKNYDPTPNTAFPKHKWHVTKSVLSREYGWNSKYSPSLFRYNCYSSLHMVERLELMYKMKKHDGCVNTLNFNAQGSRLVSGSDDLHVVIWDWLLSNPVLEYRSGHQANVFQAKFMPLSNDLYIVTCARDGQVRLGELSSSGFLKGTRKLAQHKGSAHKLSLQMDSPHYFLTCGEDASVFGIDLRQDKHNKLLLCKSKEKKVPLYTIFINPQKSFEFAVGGRCQFVKVYDSRFASTSENALKDFCPEHLVSDDKVNVTSLVYNYNGTEILGSYNDEDIYSFDSSETDTTKFVHRYRGHRNNQTVKGVNYFGPKSEYIVSGSDCGCIFFWEKETEHIINYMYGDEGGAVNCLEPNPTMPILATSGLDDDIKIWVPSCEDAPDLTQLKKHISKNMKEREEDNDRDHPDAFVDQTIWFLMQHLSRSRRRRRQAEAAEETSDETSSASSDEMEPSSMSGAPQCSQS